MTMQPSQILDLLKPDGPICQHLPGFELRPMQQEMMHAILNAYEKNQIALIEAETGTGKSIAYLIPALLWAQNKKERTVISTQTIALQEQLLHKDIPLLMKALGLNLKVVLVKGMSNYVCKRKLEDAVHEIGFFPDQEAEEVQLIEDKVKGSDCGSKSDLGFNPRSTVWERICAESDTCNGKRCPHYMNCSFIKERKKAQEAQILVVNHSLLFADLAMRKETEDWKEGGILPVYSRVVLDEAHNVEDIATEFFGGRVSDLQLLKILSRLGSEKQGKIPLLAQKLGSFTNELPKEKVANLRELGTVTIPGLRKELFQQINYTFEVIQEFPALVQGQRDQKMRLLTTHHQHLYWKESIKPQLEGLVNKIRQYVHAVVSMEKEINFLKNEKVQQATDGLCYEICALANRLNYSADVLLKVLEDQPDPNQVRWIENQTRRTGINTNVVTANLEIAETLADTLFRHFQSVVLCSATLTTNQQFKFFRGRLGLTERFLPHQEITEQQYPSPFDFQKQALFVVPTDIPDPKDDQYMKAVIEAIWEAIQASRGNAFVLFTSYRMLQDCYEALKDRLKNGRFVTMKQGDASRHDLLHQFRKTDFSVLFGTDSFWEGIDVVGDALRCVIIAKLPFKVPSEPIIQARSEAIANHGGDPFFDYAVPLAIVRFKQGFGRLIRNKKDRGCVVCLDPRVVRKGYGRQFLNSLPPCQQVYADTKEIRAKMSEFYRKTFHITKS